MLRRSLLAAGFALALGGCATVAAVSPGLLAQLKQMPGSYLSGEVKDLEQVALLNNKDFVYSVAFSPDGRKVAYSHLGPKTFLVGLWALDPAPRELADANVNHYQWDVESVAFSPDGKVVATVSRDGGVRLFASNTGALLGTYLSEEPLVSVAFHPGGKYLAVGGAKGLVSILSYPELRFAFEQRAHEAEVRNLEFTSEGVLYSGGWDKSILAFDTLEESSPGDAARLRLERRGGFNVVRGSVSGKVSASFALDARQPYVVLTSDLARAAGIEVTLLKETATLSTPMGQTVVRIARDVSLYFKSLKVSGLEVAVCDACVPAGTQAVLGEAFSRRYQVSIDELTQEVLLQAKEPDAGAEPVLALALKPRKRLTFDWYVNDFSLDHSGRHLGVAFSETKAERNREVYEREKKGLVEPVREGNAGAIVEAATGTILHKWSKHEGVVATAAISPDGRSLATGGWDKRVILSGAFAGESVKREFGWSVRRVRFSEDGRYLAVAAWTPQNPLGDQTSKPSALVYEVRYARPEVLDGPPAVAQEHKP